MVDTHGNQIGFTLLLALVMAGSLINITLFVYPSLTAYFLFAIFIAILAVVSGVILFVCIKEQGFLLSFPAVMFVTLIVYACLHGFLLNGHLNFRHNYLLLCGLLFVSVISVFRVPGYNYKTLFIIIGLLGVIESIWCLLQYIGIIETANPFFKISGSWVNPNVTAMFLTMCIPALLALRLTHNGVTGKVISVSFLLLFMALVLLNCRTAYIGAGLVALFWLNYRFGIVDRLKEQNNRSQGLFIIIFSLIVLIPIGFKLYASKKDSADGRLLIWKISTEMIAQKPLTGYGYGMFERDYNLVQAKYISSGKASNEELKNAGYVKMAYNEFLQNTVEGGVVGVILFTTLILSLLAIPIYKLRYMSPYGKNSKRPERQELTQVQAYSVAAYTGIAAFTIMSVINFTIEAIPVMCLFIVFASVITVQPLPVKPERKKNFLSLIFRPVIIPTALKNVLALLLVGSGLCIGYFHVNQANAHLQNKAALDLVVQKQYSLAIPLLQSLRGPLEYSESYWRNLGNAWYAVNNFVDAAKALEQAKAYTSSPEIYQVLGKCYERTGMYTKAEEDYVTAVNLEPSHFTPRYVLMKLYMLEGNKPKTQFMAKSILNLKPRIPSKEVQLCKEAAYMLLYPSGINNKFRQDRINNKNGQRISPIIVAKPSAIKYNPISNPNKILCK